jgi:hypothetical protein
MGLACIKTNSSLAERITDSLLHQGNIIDINVDFCLMCFTLVNQGNLLEPVDTCASRPRFPVLSSKKKKRTA